MTPRSRATLRFAPAEAGSESAGRGLPRRYKDDPSVTISAFLPTTWSAKSLWLVDFLFHCCVV